MTDSFTSIVEGTWVAPGAVSSDGVAIVGHDDFLFLVGGTNKYHAAYSQDAAGAAQDAQAWLDYLDWAHAECERRDLGFLFAVVPNKATILKEFYPLDLGEGITPRMKALMEGLNVPSVVPVEYFQGLDERLAIFRRNDSHFGYLGNYIMVSLILEQLTGEKLPWPLPMDAAAKIPHAGDLGGRFDPKMMETLIRLPAQPVSELNIETELPARGFNGTKMIAENSNAPIDKTIVVFGNSFIEKIPGWGMSPLLASQFRKLVFYWGAKIDFDLVEEHSGDLVLFQTCERFLGQAPDSGRVRPALARSHSGALWQVEPPDNGTNIATDGTGNALYRRPA